MDVLLILFVVVGLIALSSYFISNNVYKGLKKVNNGNATVLSVLVFILTFSILTIGVGALILYNIRIER